MLKSSLKTNMAQYSYWSKIKRLLNTLPYITILGSILLLLKTTWMKWGDVIIDLGKEMYIPVEISRGKILYADIHYIYGPLPIYFHTILYKLFGAHINILITCGISTIFIVSILLYKISRFFMNPFFSSLAPLTFIFVCAFGNYVYLNNYNFILPYTYAAVYGILFSLMAIYCFIKSIYNKKLKYLISYGIFSAFTILCKAEIGISLLIPAIFILFFYNIYDKKSIPIIISISPIIISIIIYCLFSLKMALPTLLYKNFFVAISSTNRLFNKWLIGITGENIYLIIYSSIIYIFLLMCLLSFDYVLNNLKDNIITRVFITFSIYLLTFIIIFIVGKFMIPYIQYRTLPVICLITLLSLRRKEENIAVSFIALFSFLLTTRIILKVSAAHYGFYILVPGLISYYLFFYNIIPRIFQKFTKNGLYYLSTSFLFILLILNHFNIYSPIYKNRTLSIEGERGSINYLNNQIGIRYKELIDYLKNEADGNKTLVVFPLGIDINFHTGMDNPIFYNTFLPFELAQNGREKEIISQLDTTRVDYIVIVQWNTTEYGPSSFGIDYGKELFNWINKNYEVVKLFGPMPFTTGEFGIAIMQRKSH